MLTHLHVYVSTYLRIYAFTCLPIYDSTHERERIFARFDFAFGLGFADRVEEFTDLFAGREIEFAHQRATVH